MEKEYGMGKHHGSSRRGGHCHADSREAKQKSLPKLADGTKHIGVVRFFNPTKGWGFIAPDPIKGQRYQDIFVHVSQIEKSGIGTIDEGHRLTFVVDVHKGKQHATRLERGA